MPSEPTPLTNDICSCGKKVRVDGFCVTCYYQKIYPKTGQWRHKLSAIDAQNKTATCAVCGLVKIRSRGNNSWRCATEANNRGRAYKKAYRQSKKICLLDHCEICGSKDKLCWDHDHITGEFRGTLCSSCNTAIGFMKDDPKILMAAINYLKRKI
jgi:hypothetical protein